MHEMSLCLLKKYYMSKYSNINYAVCLIFDIKIKLLGVVSEYFTVDFDCVECTGLTFFHVI